MNRARQAGKGCFLFVCALLACEEATRPATGVVTVKVTPEATLIVGTGESAAFSATARSGNGAVIAASPTWSVLDPAVATVSATGVATGVAAGTTTVTATVEGAHGIARLEVFVPERIARYEPGKHYFGRKRYTEYIPGKLPVILSASHGGALAPEEIPNRTYGVTRSDRNTRELTTAVREALVKLTGFAPHVVISHLHRRKLDPNREIEEAAQGNPYAELAWREFHDWIRAARATVWGGFGGGMYFDIHGHGHDIDRLELGYLLSAETLNQPDVNLNSLAVVKCTSIRELGRDSPIPFSQLLRGATSFGGLLGEEGVASVPSPEDPSPGQAPYFSGGHNTREHGSLDDGEVISGIQLEHHFPGLRDTEDNRRAYAAKAARVIRRFMLGHYGYFEPAAQGAPARGTGGAEGADASQAETCPPRSI